MEAYFTDKAVIKLAVASSKWYKTEVLLWAGNCILLPEAYGVYRNQNVTVFKHMTIN